MFLVNLLSKMKDTLLGSRIAEVHNASSLLTGDAGQGESNIRRWIIENDWLEAVVALPLNIFYNTGIATYIWILTNRKSPKRRGKIQLIDASSWFEPLRRNQGKRSCRLTDEHVGYICDSFRSMTESDESKIFPNTAFGYWKVTIERPLRVIGIDPYKPYSPKEIRAFKMEGMVNPIGEPVVKKIHKRNLPDPLHGLFEVKVGGKSQVVEYEPDPDLRDSEQIPFLEDGGMKGFIHKEVIPHIPDAWIDASSLKIGYEISFARHFYKPPQLRTLQEIRSDIEILEGQSVGLLQEILVNLGGHSQ